MGPPQRLSLRQGLDRDIYQIVKKLEDDNDGKPLKSGLAVYDAIKRSNSSLSRHKKRPLEDAIDRVLQFRREELDSSDSEAAIDQPEPKTSADDRSFLNRQMTKHWHQDTAKSSGAPPAKKRRVDNEDAPAEKTEKESRKKSQKSSKHTVEHPGKPLPLGGLDEIHRDLSLRIHLLLKQPEIYAPYACTGGPRLTGMVLSGPPGTGKSSLIQSLAADIDVPIISVSDCLEDQERIAKSLAEAVDEAMRLAPSIIYIKNLDWYMSNTGGTEQSNHSRKVINHFTQQMARIHKQQPKDRPIFAIATTSRLTNVDQAVLKPGLFAQTVQLAIPDDKARQDIFKVVTKGMSLADNVDFSRLARMTHGFVGIDIFGLVGMAMQVTVERLAKESQGQPQLDSPKTENSITDSIMDEVEYRQNLDSEMPEGFDAESSNPEDGISFEDFQAALKGYVPCLRKEGFTPIPNVTWDQVGAMHEVRTQLETSIIGPIRDPTLYHNSGLTRPAGVLLWGPPGCGKTLVAQAVANEAQASFILINGPELLNKYVGESERAVRELFERARSCTPCILFFDEIDSIVPRRDNSTSQVGARLVNALLAELDGVRNRSGIYVIGTTNRTDMIDPAMLRHGRLSVRLFVGLPTDVERVEILRTIYKVNHAARATTPDELGLLDGVARDKRCTGFSGADLGGLHVTAAEHSLGLLLKGKKTLNRIDVDDWEYALAKTKPSVRDSEEYWKMMGRAVD